MNAWPDPFEFRTSQLRQLNGALRCGFYLLLIGYFIGIFLAYKQSITKYLKREDWYMWSHMEKGTVSLPIFQSLEAFWPGLLVIN